MNELAKLRAQLPSTITQSTFKEIQAGATYLPRLQLMGSNTAAVKERKIAAGHWALVNNSIIDLGEEIIVLPIDVRPLALDLSDTDDIVRSYDPQSDLYKQIKATSMSPNSGCLSGPQFLVYIGSGFDSFATWHASTKSASEPANVLFDAVNRSSAAVLGWELAKKGTYRWEAPTCALSDQEVEIDIEAVQAQINAFRAEMVEAPATTEEDPR